MTANQFTMIRKFYQKSQQEMAELLGVSRQFISYVERGERPISKEFVAKLDDRLDLTPAKKALIYKIFDKFQIAI